MSANSFSKKIFRESNLWQWVEILESMVRGVWLIGWAPLQTLLINACNVSKKGRHDWMKKNRIWRPCILHDFWAMISIKFKSVQSYSTFWLLQTKSLISRCGLGRCLRPTFSIDFWNLFNRCRNWKIHHWYRSFWQWLISATSHFLYHRPRAFLGHILDVFTHGTFVQIKPDSARHKKLEILIHFSFYKKVFRHK